MSADIPGAAAAAPDVRGNPARGNGFLTDPRPHIVAEGGAYYVAGGRCIANGHPLMRLFDRCPRCRGEVEAARFGPAGTIWATTRVHIPAFPGDAVPYVLAYVDLDEGPRVLLRLTNTPDGAAVGDRVRLGAQTDAGNPTGTVTP
jgi:uncharacterized OB-fold protein